MDVCVPAVLPHRRYSSTIATLFTALLSAALFGHSLTLNFCIGVSIVGISMHQFFSQGPPPPRPPSSSRARAVRCFWPTATPSDPSLPPACYTSLQPPYKHPSHVLCTQFLQSLRASIPM